MTQAGEDFIDAPGFRLVLASVSPRRRRLLQDAGFPHEVVSPCIDDGELTPAPGIDPRRWAMSLSYLKARSARRRMDAAFDARTVLLAADTVVVKAREIIGQPRDEADARRILARLSDGSHEVITGVTMLRGPRRWMFADSARVTVGELSAPLVEPYIASGEWRGKAGGYNLMERIDAGWPITFTGDPSTIMGLPMGLLTPRLRSMPEAPSEAAG